MNRMMIKCPPELMMRSARRAATGGVLSPQRSVLSRAGILQSNETSGAILQRRFYKAAVCDELKKPMTIGVRESRPLGSGEVRIQVKAAGINFGDLLMLVGEYQVKLPPPFVAGSEMAGIVLEVAEDVEELEPGMRVVGLASMYGAFAEEAVTRVDAIWRMPERMDFTEAAGFVCSYGTAMLGLQRRAELCRDDDLLVTAAAGAVGLAAVDIASHVIGANVVGAAGSDEKCEVVRAKGAAHAINYRVDSIREKMREVCPGGANVVFDAVGGSVFKDALKATAWEGRVVVVGFASGEIPQIPANYLLVKNISTVGFYWGNYSVANPELFRWSVDRCFEEYKLGRIKPHIGACFDLSEINSAFDFIKSRKSSGKVVIRIH